MGLGEIEMADVVTDDRPLALEDILAWFEAGPKPADQWRVGAEHEKFVFRLGGHEPVPYAGPAGIQALLNGLTRFGWKAVEEGGYVIALERGKANVSLEPGGQFELSGAPLETMHDICEETGVHLQEVKTVADELGLGFLGLGFTPIWRRDDVPIMPKGRYKIMANYMPKVGNLGLDMMFRTCTVQANLDFSTEADMVKKLRVGLALQPVATALFANSPFTEGKPNGFLSFRSEIWRDTDADRAGMLPWAFESGMGFERWVDYALDVPMYFVKRGDRYFDVSGQSFRDLLAGKLASLPGEQATISDWANHLTTIFPEVRLKRYLEMRGADGGPWARICALPALWVGLLYDQGVLDAAWDLVKGWNAEERQFLRDQVPGLGLRAKIGKYNVRDLARDMVALSREGLKRRGRLDRSGRDESHFLAPAEEVVERDESPAEELLNHFNGERKGSAE